MILCKERNRAIRAACAREAADPLGLRGFAEQLQALDIRDWPVGQPEEWLADAIACADGLRDVGLHRVMVLAKESRALVKQAMATIRAELGIGGGAGKGIGRRLS
jgi:hypothetical protein